MIPDIAIATLLAAGEQDTVLMRALERILDDQAPETKAEVSVVFAAEP